MKRAFSFFLSIWIVCTCGLPIYAAPAKTGITEQIQLSSLSNEECIQFLASEGVTIPSQLGDIDVRNLIKTLENDPNKVFVINWTVLADFYEDIREAVKQYYGITSSSNSAVYSDYTLQYSVLAENGWYAGVGKFNCYSYALGITSAKRNP